MTSLEPPPLDWMVDVAKRATYFFAFGDVHQTLAEELGKEDSPEGTFVAFSTADFLRHLTDIGAADVWPRVRHIQRVLGRMVAEGILMPMGNSGKTFGETYILQAHITARQIAGELWLSSILGSAALVQAMRPGVVHLVGHNSHGDVVGGSGLLLDDRHVLTAGHVLKDMTIDSQILIPGDRSLAGFEGSPVMRVLGTPVHDRFDVGVVQVEMSAPVPQGLAFRDPEWGDSVAVLGYPPIPMAASAELTVQTGEVVNPYVTSYVGAEYLLFSATSRPGNSGGPIVAGDGRIVGLVSGDLETDHGPAGAADGSLYAKMPFHAGVPTSVIAKALVEMGLPNLLPIEDWSSPGVARF